METLPVATRAKENNPTEIFGVTFGNS